MARKAAMPAEAMAELFAGEAGFPDFSHEEMVDVMQQFHVRAVVGAMPSRLAAMIVSSPSTIRASMRSSVGVKPQASLTRAMLRSITLSGSSTVRTNNSMLAK